MVEITANGKSIQLNNVDLIFDMQQDPDVRDQVIFIDLCRIKLEESHPQFVELDTFVKENVAATDFGITSTNSEGTLSKVVLTNGKYASYTIRMADSTVLLTLKGVKEIVQ